MTQRTDVLGWELERDGRVAVVREDGHVESEDADFADFLRQRLAEPITVHRRGPGRVVPESSEGAILLRPGDGRYVAARVRALAGFSREVKILRIVWDQ
ncbi:MAG: hypothetical protein M0027_03310 [Candidatus Dormibacteraeota bacterium]|nr:hypothetical protein [Candidatus Dormibacteraeota bacterium]